MSREHVLVYDSKQSCRASSMAGVTHPIKAVHRQHRFVCARRMRPIKDSGRLTGQKRMIQHAAHGEFVPAPTNERFDAGFQPFVSGNLRVLQDSSLYRGASAEVLSVLQWTVAWLISCGLDMLQAYRAFPVERRRSAAVRWYTFGK